MITTRADLGLHAARADSRNSTTTCQRLRPLYSTIFYLNIPLEAFSIVWCSNAIDDAMSSKDAPELSDEVTGQSALPSESPAVFQ